MNTEQRDLFAGTTGYIDDTPKKEYEVKDRLDKFQVGGQRRSSKTRKSKSRRHRRRSRRTRQ
jgi:hypothetical protein